MRRSACRRTRVHRVASVLVRGHRHGAPRTRTPTGSVCPSSNGYADSAGSRARKLYRRTPQLRRKRYRTRHTAVRVGSHGPERLPVMRQHDLDLDELAAGGDRQGADPSHECDRSAVAEMPRAGAHRRRRWNHQRSPGAERAAWSRFRGRPPAGRSSRRLDPICEPPRLVGVQHGNHSLLTTGRAREHLDVGARQRAAVAGANGSGDPDSLPKATRARVVREKRR